MHGKRRLIHKEIIFAVEPADVSGFYRFRFQIGDKTIEGRVETNLKGMALHRASRDQPSPSKSQSPWS